VVTVSPPSRATSNAVWSASSPATKALRSAQQIAERLGPLGGQIGQVHPQQLLRHRVHRVFRQEMDALDDRVLGQDQIIARTGRDDRDIVVQAASPFRMGQRREQPFDGLEFAGDVNRGHHAPRRRAPR
jgi:hypothetical protein